MVAQIKGRTFLRSCDTLKQFPYGEAPVLRGFRLCSGFFDNRARQRFVVLRVFERVCFAGTFAFRVLIFQQWEERKA